MSVILKASLVSLGRGGCKVFSFLLHEREKKEETDDIANNILKSFFFFYN